MFYSVGFVILNSPDLTIAAQTGLPLLYVGYLWDSLTFRNTWFSPTASCPYAIAYMFNADIGKTLLIGTIIAISGHYVGRAKFFSNHKK